MELITLELTLTEILAMPGDAVLALLDKANAAKPLLQKAYDVEAAGKCRWPVLNGLRQRIQKPSPFR